MTGPRPWCGVSDETVTLRVDCDDGWGVTTLPLPAGDRVYVTEAQKAALELEYPGAVRWVRREDLE